MEEKFELSARYTEKVFLILLKNTKEGLVSPRVQVQVTKEKSYCPFSKSKSQKTLEVVINVH